MLLVNSVYNVTESIAFFDSKVWELVPEEVKQKESLNEVKFQVYCIYLVLNIYLVK